MALDLILLTAALLVLALIWRVSARGAAILRRYPPLGRMVMVAGRRVHALTMGDGPDLVMIHGASGQLRDLLPLMQRLAPKFRVTAFDRPGLGHSTSLGARGIAPADQARHLAKAAEALGLRRPIVLGQSYGGAVALAWALEVTGPVAASALVLVAAAGMPWPGKLDWSYRLTNTAFGRALILPMAAALVTDGYVEALMPSLFAPNAPPPDYVLQTGATMALPLGHLQANAMQVNGLFTHIKAMEPRYSGLQIPVELVHGLADTIVPAEVHAKPLSKLIPEAHLTLLPDTGHMPHHTHPDAVIDAINRAAARAGWT